MTKILQLQLHNPRTLERVCSLRWSGSDLEGSA
jgi:hypothetical protein